MPIASCRSCGASEIEYDSAQGSSFCVRCGAVLEENTVVAELTFGEMADGSAVLRGQFVSAERGRSAAPSIFGRRTDSSESREWTLFNAKRRLMAVGASLGLGEHHVDQAHRWYTLALQHRFTRGRRANHIVAACLYIVCRLERTPHMLLDFSDLMQTSVYVLGGTFLRLVQLLNLSIPIVDPSFYVGRFAAKLEFGEMTQQVANTTLRIVARMKRDWIQVGRRPAGVCAAGLLIAARMHGFRRSEREVVRVVHVCEATLRKRLDEFEATPSSSLTPDEFEGIWLEKEADPPSFVRNKSKETASAVLDADLNLSLIASSSACHDFPLTPPSTQNFGSSSSLSHAFKATNDETFSDLEDDPELRQILLTADESAAKTHIWTGLNQDWLDKEEAKLQAAIERANAIAAASNEEQPAAGDHGGGLAPLALTAKRPRKKRTAITKGHGSSATPVADTPAEAARKVLSTKKFSRKINYEALDELFSVTT